jgi:beta-galactosidase
MRALALSMACIIVPGFAQPGTTPSPRERLSLDKGWRFALGNAADPGRDFDFRLGNPFAKAGSGDGALGPKFDDSKWRQVDVPHDWAVELPFQASDDGDIEAHGFKPIGAAYPATSVGWYRRTFEIPKQDEGRRVSVVFDGVYRDCQVWLNGYYVGRHLSGYTGFRFDLTDILNYGGKNTLVLRADATMHEGWWYEGAGIYRHVWLEKTAPTCVAPNGLRVRSHLEGTRAVVDVDVALKGPAAGTTLQASLLDAMGQVIATRRQDKGTSFSLTIPKPRRWSLEDPYLYRAVVEVKRDGALLDRTESTFGVRTCVFDADKGFLLNGVRVPVQGVCCHQDHAGVGVAVPDALLEWRLRELKKWGVNAYRCSHHAPAPELLEICDRIGLLVLDENRLLGSSDEVLEQLRFLVERDRNHPSVIAWSLANEESYVHATPQAERMARTMKALVEELDGTRPTTYAKNGGNITTGIPGVVDVYAWNYYRLGKPDEFKKAFPSRPQWGSEEASTLCTRGEYANDPLRGYESAFDVNNPSWGSLASQWLPYFAERPWLAGAFVWTGFDYRGEPTPYRWPCISSHFGVLDTCGFPKDNAWYYKAAWTKDPVLHLAPHWNWAGREGQAVEVRALTNCDEVELFQDGRSLGRRSLKPFEQPIWKVTYAPGTLSAQGYRKGQPVVSDRVETTGAPVALRLVADRAQLKADAADVAVVRVEVVDAAGRVVPGAGNKVRFQLAGPGRFLGMGNGDPSCHEPDQALPGPGGVPQAWQRSAFHGLAQVILQTGATPGALKLTAESDGLKPAELALTTKD